MLSILSITLLVNAFLAFSGSISKATPIDKAFTPIPKLLIVSYDAFRYDYFEREVTPYMNQLRNSGTHADYMLNVFVTKTFPNHHTISTGFFAETHGVTGASYYDEKLNRTFGLKDKELYHYNNDIIPIWTANEIGGPGRRSGSMMWPGTTFEYQGKNITWVEPWNHSVPWEKRVDDLISWYKHPSKPINLGLLYIEEPDNLGHGIGIFGPRFDSMLEKVDNITKYLHEQLKKNGLEDVNVIHLSDHGMSTVTRLDIVNLTHFINPEDYRMSEGSPVISIFPKKGKEELVYKNLAQAANDTKKFDVYWRKDIPPRFHFSNNPRLGPIVVVAKIGHAFETLADSFAWYEREFNITVTDKSRFGVHGYDNLEPEMHPFFFANGPAFSKNCKLDPFPNVNLYPLFCDLLAIECLPVNGTFTGFKNCLAGYKLEAATYKAIYIGGIVISILGIILYMIYSRSKGKSNVLIRG